MATLEYKSTWTGEQIDEAVGIALDGLIEKTYSELKELKDAGELTPGAKYLLTDYVTKYRQPYTNVIKTADIVQGDITTPESDKYEPLVLTAASTDTFYPIAASLQYPQDIIWYNFDDNKCEDGTTPRKGFIQRRIDTRNNINAPHDWRTILWARFKATAPTWTSGSVTRGQYFSMPAGLLGAGLGITLKDGTPTSASDNKFFMNTYSPLSNYMWTSMSRPFRPIFDKIVYAERYTFNADSTQIQAPIKMNTVMAENIYIGGFPQKNDANLKGLSNIVFRFDNEANKPKDVYIGNGSHNLSIDGYNYGLRIENNCHEMYIGFGSYNLKIGSGSFDNMIFGSAKGTIFNNQCSTNVFYNMDGCVIGSGCTGILMDGSYNKIGAGSGNISIGNGNYNIFNAYTGNISTGSVFNYNVVDSGISNKDMSGISELHGKSYPHRITKESGESVYAIHHVGTTPIYTSIP